MLNLNRYRDRDEPTTRYARAWRAPAVPRAGRRQGSLWYAQASATVIGDDSDRYDEVIAVWYPSRAAFVALATDPEIARGPRPTAPPGSSAPR